MAKVGLLCGREFSFPPAFLARVNELGKKDGVTAELCKLGGTRMGEAPEYKVIVDRLSHEVPTFAASQAGRRSSGATRREQKRRAVLANFPCADGLNDAVIGSGDYRRDTSRD